MIRAILSILLLSLSASCLADSSDKITPKYIQLLQELVNINSDTKNLEGLAKMRNVLTSHFEALGFITTRHILTGGREVLSFEVPGANPKVLLLGHVDTVFPQTSTFNKFAQHDDRLFGPGVIDMKGGIVLMLNVLEQLKHSQRLEQVRIVLNDDEEIGSSISKHTLLKLAEGIPYGLVFEPGLEDGAVVSSQAGVRWMKLAVTGKAAHAGLEPQNGVDACLDMAKKIIKIASLSKPEKGLTVNPGVFEGGTKPNVVCDKASVTIDVRFRNLLDWQHTFTEMENIRSQSDVYNSLLRQGTSAELIQIAGMPPLPESNTNTLVHQIEIVAKSLGQKFDARGVGYGSDANHLAETGMQLLVGVGPYGGGMYTNKEYMLLHAYSDRLALMTALIRKLLTSNESPL